MTGSPERRIVDTAARARTAKGVVVSLAVHAAIAAAILGTAWSVSRARREETPPVVLVADFFDPAPATSSTKAPPETGTPQPIERSTAPADDLAAIDAAAPKGGTSGPRYGEQGMRMVRL